MTILIGQHEFDGPVTSIADIPAKPGLYALLQKQEYDLLLVDIYQSNNLAKSLERSAATFDDQLVLLLPCDNEVRRKEILHELLQEFEFDDEESIQPLPARRPETESGLAIAV